MLQRRRRRTLREVAGLVGDEHPVRHPQEGGDGIVAQAHDRFGREELTPDGHGQHHQHQCRQQPAGPSNPEVRQVDTTAAAQLVQQQRGDQESTQHEKHVDAEEPARHTGDAAVVGQHQRDRQRAHAIERTNTRTALWTVTVVARPAGGQPARRWRGDPSGLPSRMNRHGVRPGRFHVHLSSAPTGFLVGGFVAADTRVPLPADAGVSLGAHRPHQRQTRRGRNRNMLSARQLRPRAARDARRNPGRLSLRHPIRIPKVCRP